MDVVLHFAANMGGMGIVFCTLLARSWSSRRNLSPGTIHSRNDFYIYEDNQCITMNLLSAAVRAGVKKFFYASSACVYPESLQEHSNRDVSLREVDVWGNASPQPQGLYGSEKLTSELLIRQFSSTLDIRIARFHNVYGPGGAWDNGREKAPAAMLRKALAAKYLGSPTVEIWGDGSQRRSFLWVGDAVDAVLMLLDVDCNVPVNIGSDRAVSIQELANIALDVTDVDPSQVQFIYDRTKPIGVGSRNSNNDLVFQKLRWRPTTTLEDGMRRTRQWMEEKIRQSISSPLRPNDIRLLETFQHSQMVDLPSGSITFAMLLPITSRGLELPNDCLSNLSSFADSLVETTWRDTHELGGTRYRFKIYLAVDDDDEFLRKDGGREVNRALETLKKHLIVDVVPLICTYPRGHVCQLWQHCAQRAWNDGCDYLILVGDDVEFEDVGWMHKVHQEFLRMAENSGAPPGFGCVALTDTTFPGMPTFPVLHKTHMDIFDGKVIPDLFVNQDGDPFLFQLYRRWGCSSMITSKIRNSKGGPEAARYRKQPACGWAFGTLDGAISTVERWLEDHSITVPRKLAIDIVIPSYRVQVPLLDNILRLKPSSTCTAMFIIIVDDPRSSSLAELESKYGQRVDVRIRVNSQNAGASASRNRGMTECAGEWIHFLDDDVVPDRNLLIETENAIRGHVDAAGFVGHVGFPVADTVFTTAVHLSGVTYFWDIAKKMADCRDLPWGVTANLIVRREQDGVEFDPMFPKTGGGEDIDFVLKKRAFSMKKGRVGFHPAPAATVSHPWWNGGKRSYWRFFKWSEGDGGLVTKYPEYTYRDGPNSGEMLLVFSILVGMGGIMGNWRTLCFGVRGLVAVVLSNMIHHFYAYLWRNPERGRAIQSTLCGKWWLVAIAESSLICMASEVGRLLGILRRGEMGSVGKRFDWFVGRIDGPRYEERLKGLQRLTLMVVIMVLFVL